MPSLSFLLVPYIVVVGGGVGHFVVKGFRYRDASAMARGVTLFGVGLGGFIIVALAATHHTVGAIAATAVIGPMCLGGFLLWYFVFRDKPRRADAAQPAAETVAPPTPAAEAAATAPPRPRRRFRGLMPVLALLGSIPGFLFAADLIADGHTVAGIGSAAIVVLLAAAVLTVRHVIALTTLEREAEEEGRRQRAEARARAAESEVPVDDRRRHSTGDVPHRRAETGTDSAGGPRKSQVETRFVRMTLDHGAGTLSGEIVAGPERGRSLESLEPARLMALLERWRQEDPTSAVVVESWLDRTRPEWRDEQEAADSDRPTISRDEAFAILGLKPGADPAAIKDTHRRLMTRVHPDQGGSDWLAAKVNEARAVLLNG